MKCKIVPNAVNQFYKGTDIFTEGEEVTGIALVLKGRILVHNDGSKLLMNSGAFIGINDLFRGVRQSTYTTQDDAMLYIFGINRSDDMESILSINKDYHGLIIASHNKIINELDRIFGDLIKLGIHTYRFIKDYYKEYKKSAEELGFSAKSSKLVETIEHVLPDLEPEQDRINYYIECSSMPLDVVKAYYSYGNNITLYQIRDQIEVINKLIDALKEYSASFMQLMSGLYNDSDSCLFRLFAEYAIDIEAAGGSVKPVLEIIDKVIEQINTADNFCEHNLGKRPYLDRRKMEDTYHMLLTGTGSNSAAAKTYLKYTREDTAAALSELKNSFEKILEYAGVDEETAEGMKEVMLSFINMKDRISNDDYARAIRKKLTVNHYIILKAVFIRAYRDKEVPRIIDMFLNYGYADERLLSEEQLLSLYFLNESKTEEEIPVYNLKEWLTLIYEGRKDPSKNEFDQEYPEVLASYKKQGKYSDSELKEMAVNPDIRLEYEIQNMIRYNNRTTNGQITSFVPVLHKDMSDSTFDRLYLTPDKVADSVRELMETDYSIFDREVIYAGTGNNISKEYIIKRVYPDIILMPTVGVNGIMWQEITGRKRDSAGRFLLPVFCESDLNQILVKVFGRFRWEMCRTIEGLAWNDIKHKSLTAEYCDYLQFYRKNRELSEERKEKIKQQIQRGRNTREIFVIDYEQWINYEARGAVKLSKPVREILATYCPFSRKIRDALINQPLFEEAMARFVRERNKKIREMEGRFRQLVKDNVKLTKELEDTLNYYKET